MSTRDPPLLGLGILLTINLASCSSVKSLICAGGGAETPTGAAGRLIGGAVAAVAAWAALTVGFGIGMALSSITSPFASSTARSITFCNSRTLPGQEYANILS